MFAKDFRQYIIAPTLKEINLWSESAEILVYGTPWAETDYDYLVQINNPKDGGYGLFQDEPVDYYDLVRWLHFEENEKLLESVLAVCDYAEFPAHINRLISDLKLAAICCRLHYYRAPSALPDANDAAGMAQYHKDHYNQGGDANVAKNTILWQEIIDGKR